MDEEEVEAPAEEPAEEKVRTTAAVFTISDSRFAGQGIDRSGPAVAKRLEYAGFDVTSVEILPDNREGIIEALMDAVSDGVGLVVTTGGTGLGARDFTPQATSAILDYEVPGLAEQMRRAGFEKTPYALLSRGVTGVRQGSLILNLPGSTDGALQSLEAVLDAIPHAITLLRGEKPH